MATIRATARSLTAEQGSIGYIIDLLEDPDTARYDLKSEINAVTASATKCHEAAKAITAKFQYWHLVITHLKQVSLTKSRKPPLGSPFFMSYLTLCPPYRGGHQKKRRDQR